jgi:hypothetical protein
LYHNNNNREEEVEVEQDEKNASFLSATTIITVFIIIGITRVFE